MKVGRFRRSALQNLSGYLVNLSTMMFSQPTEKSILGFRVANGVAGAFSYLIRQLPEAGKFSRWSHGYTGAGKNHETPVPQGI